MDLNGFSKKKSGSMFNTDWADWLSNDDPPSPTAKEELRRQRVKQAGIYTPRGFNQQSVVTASPTASVDKSLVINLHLPKLNSILPNKVNLDKLKTVKLTKRRLGFASAAILVLFLIQLNPAPADPQSQLKTNSAPVVESASTASKVNLASTSNTQLNQSPVSISQPSKTPAVANSSTRTNPTFTPVAPGNQPQLKQSVFGRTAYDSQTNVYTILDTFGGGPVTINETTVATNSSVQTTIQQNAAKISASQTITLSTGTAYLTVADSSGQQTAVLAVGNVMVYINSRVSHSSADWQTYLNNLN